MSIKERVVATFHGKLEKFNAKDTKEIEEKKLKPIEVIEWTEHMTEEDCLLTEGISELIDLLCGLGTPTTFSNANAYIGVGNDGTAPAPAQTGLIGASKLYKAMNATYPQKSGSDSIFQADFIDGEAEWNWLEETIANGNSDAAVNLCRQNTDLGTKPAGQTWRLTGTITWS